jgi:hypothetical protein
MRGALAPSSKEGASESAVQSVRARGRPEGREATSIKSRNGAKIRETERYLPGCGDSGTLMDGHRRSRDATFGPAMVAFTRLKRLRVSAG